MRDCTIIAALERSDRLLSVGQRKEGDRGVRSLRVREKAEKERKVEMLRRRKNRLVRK